MTDGVPLLGDIPLEHVQSIEHALDAGFRSTRIVGLEGSLQQRVARRSHCIRIEGELLGADAVVQLGKLQTAAESGEEVNFAADISSALELSKVVVSSFRAVETAGRPGRFRYAVEVTESPPLPPPAELEPFGGLGDFGLGDLGFDTDVLGDLKDMAGKVAGAVDTALDVADQLSSLADLADLGDLGGLLSPMDGAVSDADRLSRGFGDAAGGMGRVFDS